MSALALIDEIALTRELAAALKHHFSDRDNVLRSMLPWIGRERPR
jgi:cytochrome b561